MICVQIFSLFLCGFSRGGLAIGDTGGIPGGPTGLGRSKTPAHPYLKPALASDIAGTAYVLGLTEHINISSEYRSEELLTEIYSTPGDLYLHSWFLFSEHFSSLLI